MLVKNYFTMMSIVSIIIALTQLFYSAHALTNQSTDDAGLDLMILHNNDMHAHFEQTDEHSGTCRPKAAAANKCFGGFARVSSVVKQYRRNADNGGVAVLYLNAGDSFTGTPWYSMFGHQVVSDFLNILKPDAMVCLIFFLRCN